MRFLVNAQLPPALAPWLTDMEHEAEHVGDKGMQPESNTAIWDCALASSAPIATQNEEVAA